MKGESPFFGLIKISYFIQIGNVSCNQDDCYNGVRVGVSLIVQPTPCSALAICISLTFIWYSRQGGRYGKGKVLWSFGFYFHFYFIFFRGFCFTFASLSLHSKLNLNPMANNGAPCCLGNFVMGAPCAVVLPDPFVSPCTRSVLIVVRSRWLSHLPFAVHLADLTLLAVLSLFTSLSTLTLFFLFLSLPFPSLSLSPQLVPWPFAAAKLLSLCSLRFSLLLSLILCFSLPAFPALLSLSPFLYPSLLALS